MRRGIVRTTCLVALAATVAANGARGEAGAPRPFESRFHGGPFGPHAIGLAVVETRDFSRTLGGERDAAGKRLRHENARPIRVVVWYPAVPGEGRALTFADYVTLAVPSTRPIPGEGEAREAQLSGYLATSGSNAEHRRRERLLEAPALARRDAGAAPGPFPLVLYAPSFNASPIENHVLCELLASHGMIVAASASMGAESATMTADAAGVEAQVRDLEFLIAHFHGDPRWDGERVGAVGFSWGGLTSTLLALRHGDVDAVVSLDGSIGYPVGLDAVEHSPWLRPRRLRAAFLMLVQKPIPGLDLRFLEEARYAPRHYARFDLLSHMHFAAHHLVTHVPEEKGREGRLDRSYEAVCRATVAFLRAHLRGDAAARAFLREHFGGFSEGTKSSPSREAAGDQASPSGPTSGAPAATAGGSSGAGAGSSSAGEPFDPRAVALEARFLPPLPPPPTTSAFLALLREEGLAAARRRFRELRAADPGVQVFTEQELNRVGYILLRAGRVDDAIETFRLNAEAYPGASNVYDSLAEAYLAKGDTVLAEANYRRSLQLDPENTNAREALARILAEDR